jgi:opacity protein-like surface antigen
MNKVLLGAVLIIAATSAAAALTPTPSFAQSQPNYGPNSPGGGDTFGEPYSGTAAARRKSGGW